MAKRNDKSKSRDDWNKSNDDRCNDKRNRSGRSAKRRTKKTEINVDDRDINMADIPKGKGNDPSWYNHYPELVRDSASLSFALPLGTPVPWGSTIYPATTPPYYSVPGICVLQYGISFGQPTGFATDAINTAANRLYTFVRHSVSTYAQYDSTDLMLYISAMDSIYALYSTACRIYGLAQNYKVFNRYFASGVINALGYDPNDLFENLADYRSHLNQLCFKVAQFCVPNGIDVMKRHVWMSGNLFYDAGSVKSQLYAYNLAGYYQYTETDDTGVSDGAYLAWTPITYPTTGESPLKFSQLLNRLSTAISAVMASQDCIAMSGDLLRAFGQDNVYVLSPIAENYIVEPVYSPEVLSQIENATILGTPDTHVNNAHLVQRGLNSTGQQLRQVLSFHTVANPASDGYKQSLSLHTYNWMLNFHKGDVTPDDVMVATRLTNICRIVTDVVFTTGSTTSYGTGIQPHRIGSDFIISMMFFNLGKNGFNQLYRTTEQYLARSVTAAQIAQRASYWSVYDWAPRLWPQSGNDVSPEWSQLLDVDNYSMLSEANIDALHETAMLSLYACPAIGQLSKKPVYSR